MSQAKKIRFDHEISDSESECSSTCRNKCASATDYSELGEVYVSADMVMMVRPKITMCLKKMTVSVQIK